MTGLIYEDLEDLPIGKFAVNRPIVTNLGLINFELLAGSASVLRTANNAPVYEGNVVDVDYPGRLSLTFAWPGMRVSFGLVHLSATHQKVTLRDENDQPIATVQPSPIADWFEYTSPSQRIKRLIIENMGIGNKISGTFAAE